MIASALVGCALVAVPALANADSYTTDFESSAFTVGAVNDQDSWRTLCCGDSGPFDTSIVANDGATTNLGFGGQSFQVSNAVATTAISQTFSPALTDSAGESTAPGGTGTRKSHFRSTFSFGAFEQAYQEGLSVQVAVANGDTDRSFSVQIRDTEDGLRVLSQAPIDNEPGVAVTWPGYQPFASGLSRSEVHTLQIDVYYVDGEANDIVRVKLNGELVQTTTTWEQYYRNDPEREIFDNELTTAASLLFNARTIDGQVPALAGEGLLIDNLTIQTDDESPHPPQDPGQPNPPSEPNPPSDPTPTPKVDGVAPTLQIGGKGGSTGTVKQGGFAKHKKAITLTLKCNERCALKATGGLSLKVNGKRIKLKAVTRTLKRGSKATIKLRLSPAARKAVKRALRDGKVVKAKIALRVRDSAGNVRVVRRTVRLRA